ncbi:uncharacterized protein LOC108253693 [Diaphorina citri]|uniref:Uncharacterized protein LOC108253693 n=1 Tax=Diaphorina citri TaxID=121845 RepID=A0A3Q0JDX7_DIACI|nr:uncharacterized protein LOC108253693 [Diaphorina citri]XP_026686619.1 uncharacterized protein LOC108253693 [Diaphorina citri]XP_026686620.1 uncharacterized protein LOC108253693 [Diaphorina citri]
MDRIFRGIMKYRTTDKKKMVEQFVHVKNNPHVRHLFFLLPQRGFHRGSFNY